MGEKHQIRLRASPVSLTYQALALRISPGLDVLHFRQCVVVVRLGEQIRCVVTLDVLFAPRKIQPNSWLRRQPGSSSLAHAGEGENQCLSGVKRSGSAGDADLKVRSAKDAGLRVAAALLSAIVLIQATWLLPTGGAGMLSSGSRTPASRVLLDRAC